MRRRIFHTLISTLALAPLLTLWGCGGGSATASDDMPPTDAAPPAAERLAVTRGDLHPRLLLTGAIEAEDALPLNVPNVDIFPVQLQWIIDDGQAVKAGDVVAEFDNQQLVTNLDNLKSQADEAYLQWSSERSRVSSELAELRFTLERQRGTAEKARIQASVPEELKAPVEYQQLQLELTRAELQLSQTELELETRERVGQAEVEVARLAYEKAQGAIEILEDSIDRLRLTAPNDGLVSVAQNFREGRLFKPGDSTFPGRPIARLPNLDTLYVEARLFDVDDGRLQSGRPVEARLDAFPDTLYRGTVRTVGEVAEESGRRSRRRFFRVLIDLEAPDPDLMLPGMSVQVVVLADPLVDVLLAPRQSLDFNATPPRLRLANGQWVTPELGPCDTRACVIEGGVEEGTRLDRAPVITTAGGDPS